MKTSELKRILSEDLVECYQETDDVIYGQFWTVSKKEQTLLVHGVIPLGVLKVLGEYTNTPISEREDEKKYTLKYNDKDFEMMNSWLCQRSNGKFWFSIHSLQEFTQSEIDNFPQEIRGAIECGFLKKVEVKG